MKMKMSNAIKEGMNFHTPKQIKFLYLMSLQKNVY